MKAIKTVGSNRLALLSDVPIPHVRADRILVRNEAVALNPADWKFVDLVPCTGAMVGCDYAGVVKDVGHDLTVAFKKGDRVAGFVHGISPSDPESGAFSEYVLAKSGCSLKIPDSMSFENACALGVGITTVGQAMYESLELPWPGSPGKGTPVLIYGGSTATGTLAIQMAKL
jgi:NADPH:quinone reductase-like Zn-dependent oxidoreductase